MAVNWNVLVLCNAFCNAIVSQFQWHVLSKNVRARRSDWHVSKCVMHGRYSFCRGISLTILEILPRTLKVSYANVRSTSSLYYCINYWAKRVPYWCSHTQSSPHSKNLINRFLKLVVWPYRSDQSSTANTWCLFLILSNILFTSSVYDLRTSDIGEFPKFRQRTLSISPKQVLSSSICLWLAVPSIPSIQSLK